MKLRVLVNLIGEAQHMQVCKWLFPTKDSHRPDITVSLTDTSLCTYAVEPPCTERYARWWCAAKAVHGMRAGPSAGTDRQTRQITLRRSVKETG